MSIIIITLVITINVIFNFSHLLYYYFKPGTHYHGHACHHISPKWVYDCNHKTCMNCAAMWGILEMKEDIECPICMEVGIGVKQLKCDHMTCINCFRRCQYGEETKSPPFPYSGEKEDEYDEDPDNKKWLEDELIKKWIKDCDKYEENKEIKYHMEKSLRVCPLCRK